MNTNRWQWLAAAILLGSKAAMAGSATGALAVSATVSLTCSVTTIPLNFGAYNPVGKLPTDATGLLDITCTEGAFYNVTLDAGTHPSIAGDATTRRMTGTDRRGGLPYALFMDSARMTLWGHLFSITDRFVMHVGNGAAQRYPVYGRITAGQYAPAGLYADTVIATLTYH